MKSTIATINNYTDFFNLLHHQFDASSHPTDFGQTYYADGEVAKLKMDRFMFSPGFELTINHCTYKEDVILDFVPNFDTIEFDFKAIEFKAIYPLHQNKIINDPNIFLRFYTKDGSSKNCSTHYQKGEYLAFEMFILINHLSSYMNITSLIGLSSAEYEIVDKTTRKLVLPIFNQIIERYNQENMQKIFFQAKSLELLSIVTPILKQSKKIFIPHLKNFLRKT
jgi:hypothetical protein